MFTLTEFHETWCESYTTGDRSKDYLPSTSNSNMADAQTCHTGQHHRHLPILTDLEKSAAFVEVIFLLIIK
jgi:hypothetical protein